MASDLSNILNNELKNTLDQLLSMKIIIDDTQSKKINTINEKLIEVATHLSLRGFTSEFNFYIPETSAVKFEYFMLGGTGQQKKEADDETIDAINEIVSNICGGFSTSVNAQGLDDVSTIRIDIQNSRFVTNGSAFVKENAFEFKLSSGKETFSIIIIFDKLLLSYFSQITGLYLKEQKDNSSQQVPSVGSLSGHHFILPSKNLELLYNVKLKLSVRLGTKIVLLKDILRWDLGEIIELEQMVNEPLEILVNGIRIGEGEAVIVDGKFGLKIKRIIHEDIKTSKIGL